GPQSVERTADDVSGIRPFGDDVRLVIEGHDEELVARIEQLEEESIDRGARVLNALPVHAVARVEQDAKTDWNAFVGELSDRLALAVLEDVECVARQPGEEAPVGLAHRRRHTDDPDPRPQHSVY